jgi:hypothetical protein
MKFLGIETKIIGDNYSTKYILKTLHDLETHFKIYINPKYLDKFFFVVNIFGQNLYCDMTNITNNDGEMVCNSYFSIYNLNESQNNTHLLEQLKTDYLELIADNETVYSCIKAIEEFDTDYNQSDEDSDKSKFENAIFTFNTVNSEEIDESLEYFDFEKDEQENNELEVEVEDTLEDANEVLDNPDEVVNKDQEEEIKKTITKIINCSVKTKKYVKISLFKRDAQYDDVSKKVIYDKECLLFINSFLLSNSEKINNDVYNIKNISLDDSKFISENLNDSLSQLTRIFKDCHELNEIYMQKTQYSFELITTLMTNQSGIYLNPNDIRFSIFINRDIGTNCSNEDIIEDFQFMKFNKVSYRDVYKYNYDKNSIIDRISFSIESCIICDLCEETGSTKTSSYFYSEPNVGDICKKCYECKKREFYNRIRYLKGIILKAGKISLFKKDKEVIVKRLSNIKLPKISKKRKHEISQKAFELVTKTYNPPTCKICFGEIMLQETEPHSICPQLDFEINMGNTNVSVSSCGHIFHTQCISGLINQDTCPYCRQDSNFTRIFL